MSPSPAMLGARPSLPPDDVFVVAGGWSVRHVDTAALWGRIIGVNDAGLLLPRADIVVSMDRLWVGNRWQELCRRAGRTFLQRDTVPSIAEHPEWLTVFDCDHENTTFSEESGILNGTNSGLVAMNLAYLMRPARLFLLGFDMSRGPRGELYWYPPYPWALSGGTSENTYERWSKQFSQPAALCHVAGIQVINVSLTNTIGLFATCLPSDLETFRP